MSEPTFHRFLDLDETERTFWIARFIDTPESREALYERPFPVLRPGEQPFTWIIDQFRRVKSVSGLPGRIRRSVAELIIAEGGRHGVRNRSQVLGELLEVGVACGFSEVAAPLRAWVRDDRYAEAGYEIPGARKSVRGMVWSSLIGWRETEGLINALRRDLDRDLDCVQLCFAELGRLAPEEAIERIPATFSWPEPYWREVLRRFLKSLGARQVTLPRYRAYWERCFAEIIWSSRHFAQVERYIFPEEAPFERLLRDVGLIYQRTGTQVRLRPAEPAAPSLTVDVGSYKQDASDSITEFSNAMFRESVAKVQAVGR